MKTTLAALILLTATLAALGDYVSDRKDAVALTRQGKNQEALSLYLKMAEAAGTDVQKSDALEQASICADNLQQTDRAMELATQIPIVPVSKLAQLRVLVNNRKWQEAVAQYKDEKIDAWPDNIKGDALFLRGNAFLVTKDGASAARDLEAAIPFLTNHNSKGLCLNMLGDTYRTLNDDEKAIAAYRRTYTTSNQYKQAYAAMSVASIFQKQGKPQLAVDELAKVDIKTVEAAYWRGRMLSAKGSAVISAGRKDEGLALYREGLALPDLPNDVRSEIEAALAAATNPAPVPAPAKTP